MTKDKRIGRTALWPMFYHKKNTDRMLSVFAGNSIILETGEHVTVKSFAMLIDILFSKNLIVFTSSITSKEIFPFLQDCICDKGTEVIANREGVATSIRIKRKGSTRWVVPSKVWELAIDDNFMPVMREMYNFVGVGIKPTPSSTGSALLSQEWTINNFKSISGCNAMCANYIYKNRVGGRCDTICEKGSFYSKLIEIDMASGYLAHLLKMINGTCILFLGNDCWEFFSFFCECEITIKEELALGPFPMKTRGNIVYPTLPGTYKVHVWKEQIEDCIEEGCTVKIIRGYGWNEYTEDTLSSCRRLYSLRVNAENEIIEKMIKKITTSAIGRFGMNSTFYHLVLEELSQEGENCILSDDNKPLEYYIHETNDYTQPSMIHWYAYNLMQCARTLYKYALPYAKQGRLIMTNYDAIIVLEENETSMYAQKHTLEAKMCEMGEWRWKRLTNVTIKGSRSLECDQYVSLPGVKR